MWNGINGTIAFPRSTMVLFVTVWASHPPPPPYNKAYLVLPHSLLSCVRQHLQTLSERPKASPLIRGQVIRLQNLRQLLFLPGTFLGFFRNVTTERRSGAIGGGGCLTALAAFLLTKTEKKKDRQKQRRKQKHKQLDVQSAMFVLYFLYGKKHTITVHESLV